MNSKINDGGPAFPSGSVRKHRSLNDPGGEWVEVDRVQPLHAGLSLRDHFATSAMSALTDDLWPDSGDRREIARLAYAMADAMLEARLK